MEKEKEKLKLNEQILLSVNQASELLNIQVPTTYRLIKKGYLKALKLGVLKIRREEIDRFLREAEGYDFSDLDNVVPIIDTDEEKKEKKGPWVLCNL